MIRIDETDIELTIPEFLRMIGTAAGIMAAIIGGLAGIKWLLCLIF